MKIVAAVLLQTGLFVAMTLAFYSVVPLDFNYKANSEIIIIDLNYVMIQVVMLSLVYISTYIVAMLYFRNVSDSVIKRIYVKNTIIFAVVINSVSILGDVMFTGKSSPAITLGVTLGIAVGAFKNFKEQSKKEVFEYKNNLTNRPEINTD